MKTLCSLIISFSTIFNIAAQTKVEDAVLPNTIASELGNLSLNGYGVREKLWFDLYAIGLYLKSPSSDGNRIATANEAMAIHMEILSSLISKKKLIDAFESGIQNTNTPEMFTKISPDLKKFLQFIDGEINIGDTYRIIYSPNKGTSLYINNTEAGTISGLDFKTALFNIWLAKKSVDDDLKLNLLAK